MIKSSVLFVCASLLCVGCRHSGTSITERLAEQLETEIIAAFEAEMPLTECSASGGRAGNIVVIRKRFLVKDDGFDIGRTQEIAERAVRTWGGMDAFALKGIGRSGNALDLHFGDKCSHLFCDVIGYYDEKYKSNIVAVIINVVE